MVRFLHTSDWHLGRLFSGKSLIDDQAFALERLLELIDRVKPDALVICGDIFDRPTPPEAAVALLDRFLHESAGRRALPVLIIPGNHDSCERLGFASGLLRDRGVTIFSRVEDAFQPVRVRGKFGEISFFGIPFVEPAIIARALGREEINSIGQATSALCTEILARRTEDNPAVLLCHAFVAGGEVSESEKDIFIGGSSVVDANAFQGFAYTALGHLHKPQRAGSERIRYSGSLLPYSKSEIGHAKSIVEVRIAQDAKVEIESHHLPQLRQLRYIEGELIELLKQAELIGASGMSCEDYIIAAYTDRGAVLDAFTKLHAFYPNLLNVSRRDLFKSDGVARLEMARREHRELSDLELFALFFNATTGTDLTEPEREALIQAFTEIEHEART